MGTCLSIQFSGDIGQSLDRIFRFRNLKKNLNDLDREMKYLTAIKDEVMNKVTREERLPHTQRRPTVREWLARVEEVDTRSTNLVSTSTAQLQNLYLCGLCSTNVRSSYNYMESVLLLLEEVTKLIDDGKFETVTELTPTPEVMERPTWHTVGQEEMLERAWTRLMDENVGIMGLHGMGGVGKTTLFKKIHNKFAGIAGEFDTVIWVVVSQGATITKVQEDIAQKLHLCGDEWTKQNQSDRAAEIYSGLKKKRFVLMLDDIWEKVDLEALGVPEPTRENGCKVAFTTRSREYGKSMGDHEPMQVKCLKKDQAWELFKGKIGDNTLRRVPVELARKVADKCHGLPLALSVIGGTMASKTTVQEWEDAIDTLTRSAREFSDMENDILPILKFSYDNLKHEHIKSCFVYCALFPEDYLIKKERLIEYWICEGFMGEYQDLRIAINKGYGVLGTLTCANLLMEVDTETVVMHDVVREMALWIASDLGKNKENFVVQARVGLRQVPRVKNWGAVRRMSLMGNEIEEMTCSSKCSELTTLLLQKNDLKNLSGEVIQYMRKLLVLDLSYNDSIKELPEQISELTSLQYLDLSHTPLEQLPVGFQELKKLTHLNLTSTYELCSISGISKLSSLRSLKLFGSNVEGDVNLVKELQLLEHLQVLTINVSTELGLEQISGDRRLVNCIYRLSTRNFQEKPFNLSLLVSMKNLRGFWLTSIRSDTKWEGSEIDSSDLLNPRRPCFTNLSEVYIVRCRRIKDLTWLLFAPKLIRLNIESSFEVEEVINKEKATKLTGLSPFEPFEKLEELYLDKLPRLESIYWSPLPFQLLKRIKIENCPKLRKLPLKATSVSRIEKLSISIHPREQQTELEWEDEDTKNRFLPLILKRLWV
ncbi:LOW QUALITY PROTEIN: probable disease resistance protein At1g61300 [Raphanus sativus]|uniref:LOW QUALITY PROTEIN: probable disease resistance protein At1g61300 n=1 Tax=Raphanus sativus TaxID=3726 RepID=A0A9W3CCV2_RAPSA|nr:LOW QUALITY PROTEIN: probable disease resistance protein At1g61300 [Raphanus sativus]